MRHLITIANRFTPFTHTPGVRMLLPGTPYVVQAFPTLIKIRSEEEEYQISLVLTGPVEGFTALQNQEKNRIEIFGKAKEGFFLFYLTQKEQEISFILRRGKGVEGSLNGKRFLLGQEGVLTIPVKEKNLVIDRQERLSFGVHKKLCWESVEKRFCMKELLPLLFFLGQKYPAAEFLSLKEEKEFKEMIQCYFSGLLTPQIDEPNFLGLHPKELPSKMRKEALLASFYSAIRALFFQEKENEFWILPNLWPSLPSGRIVSLKTTFGEIAIEWTKKKLRRLHLRATKTGEIAFEWPKEVSSYRIKRHSKERGIIQQRLELLAVEAGKNYLLDRFQK